MTPPPYEERIVFEHCLDQMSAMVPQLREAVSQEDGQAIPALVRNLRKSLRLLGLPMLFQLSQEIEFQCGILERSVWLLRCDHFCDQLERINFSLQQRLEGN